MECLERLCVCVCVPEQMLSPKRWSCTDEAGSHILPGKPSGLAKHMNGIAASEGAMMGPTPRNLPFSGLCPFIAASQVPCLGQRVSHFTPISVLAQEHSPGFEATCLKACLPITMEMFNST